MLFVPRQVALASSHPTAAAAMAKEVPRKEKKGKSKAAKGSAAAPDARAAVVASVAAFLESGGFPRTLAALQSEANLEAGAWRSSPVSLEGLVAKFLESSNSAPVAVIVGSDEQDKATDGALQDAGNKKKKDGDTVLNEADTNASAPSSLQEDKIRGKKNKKKKGGAEACESESKASEPSAQEKPNENTGGETKEKRQKKKGDSLAGNAGCDEANGTVKRDGQKFDGKKKKSKKQEKDDDVEASLEKVEFAINKKFEAADKLKEDGNTSRQEEQKSQNHDADGALDKAKKKKKGKSASETLKKIDAGAAPAGADGDKGKSDAVETVKDYNEKKTKKKRKKSDSEENVQVEGKEDEGKGSVPKPDDENKSGMEIEESEDGRPSSENAVVGKKRKLEEVEGSNPLAKENGTDNQTLSNGFEDNSKENSTISNPSKRQKQSSEPKTVNAFQRVKMEDVKFADERLQDNSYWAKSGAESGYGAKAQEVLGQVRGRGFRHEKTKKKRGTYRGGQIDLQTHSIKFNNSDDE
ncbi:suppressor protein SRP40-like [Phragmites australis]|uniref:suppressor protein SRP40-like n=1 Tax=Phragmites australis TaxID=29695 RepID=UPI002D79AAED|nr:suppressor protein SRP40-like [Phragmites australis]